MTIIFQTSFIGVGPADNSVGLTDADLTPDGDTIRFALQQTSSPQGDRDEVIAAANMAEGLGGNGFRHHLGDTVNSHGGGIQFDFAAGQTEIFFRYYERYKLGFTWGARIHQKAWYYNEAQPPGAPARLYFGYIDDSVALNAEQHLGGTNIKSGTHSWTGIQGGSSGDGLWHLFQWHFKMNTDNATSDGIAQCWVDGELAINVSNVHFRSDSTATWDYFRVSNVDTANNSGAAAYVDFDDIVVDDAVMPGAVITPSTYVLRPSMLVG